MNFIKMYLVLWFGMDIQTAIKLTLIVSYTILIAFSIIVAIIMLIGNPDAANSASWGFAE